MRRFHLAWRGETYLLAIGGAGGPPEGFDRMAQAEAVALVSSWLLDHRLDPGLHAAASLSDADPFPPGEALVTLTLRDIREGGMHNVALFRRRSALGNVELPSVDLSDLAPAEPPPSEKPPTTWFELTVVDEVGEAIADLELTLTVDGAKEKQKTDGSGKVRIDGAELSFASASIVDVQALRDIVEPRWEEARDGEAPPPADDVTHVVLSDDLGKVSLAKEVPHTLVIKPRLGKIFMELFDKTGRTRLAGRSYEIAGPVSLSGTTDEDGRLLHPEVPFGDYELTLTLEGEDFSDTYTATAVVLDPADEQPQVRMIGVLPRCEFVRVRGMVFETNKNFVLPMAIPSLQRIRDIYEENDPAKLLIVGHTDTTGDAATNDPLSVERAESVEAYLTDNVEPWLKMYDHKSQSKRWGAAEDLMMIGAVLVLDDKPANMNEIEFFQRHHNERVDVEGSSRPKLATDGIAGPKTRRELIKDYMMLDGTSLAEDDDDHDEFDIEITVHGCGENFPLDETGEELDQAAADAHEDAQDRRTELFFFDPDFGIVPPPPGKNSKKGSTEYPTWRKRATKNDDLWVGPHVLEGRMTYADGSPAAHVAFVVMAGEKAIDGGYTDADGRYKLTVFSDRAEVALVDRLAIGNTPEDEGGQIVAVVAEPDRGGVAVA